MAHGTQKTRQVYTCLGLRRVKPYVQFLVCIASEVEGEFTSRDSLAHIILADRQGQFNQSPGWLRLGTLSLIGYTIVLRSSGCLAVRPTSWCALQVVYQIRSSARIFWKVFWAIDQVGRAHCQVGESSDGPDPLVRDGRELSLWGPRGTHVSQTCAAEQKSEASILSLIDDSKPFRQMLARSISVIDKLMKQFLVSLNLFM
jgi:hypothetical protein